MAFTSRVCNIFLLLKRTPDQFCLAPTLTATRYSVHATCDMISYLVSYQLSTRRSSGDRTTVYFQHAQFIPIVGVGKRGAH